MENLRISKLNFKHIHYGVFYFSLGFYLLRIFSFASYGLDFTDEGRHLNEIKFSRTYNSAASQFGLVIKPIANLVNFNIPSLRVFNLGLTFVLSFLALQMHVSKSDVKSQEDKNFHYVSCLSFGLLGLTFFNVWLPTPSYYSLAFQSLLLYWISFKYLGLEKNISASRFRLTLLSLTSSLVFLAKPTSFIIVFLISVISICFFSTQRLGSLLLYSLVTLFFLTLESLLFFGDPIRLLERVLKASQFMSIQDPLYRFNNIFRIDPFPFSWKLLFLLAALSFVAGSLIRTYEMPTWKFPSFRILSQIFIFAFLLYILISNFNFDTNPIIFLISTLFFAMSFHLRLEKKFISQLKLLFDVNLGLLFLPLAYAIGTNGNLWIASSLAMFFIVLYSWDLVCSINSVRLVRISCICILVITLPLSVLSLEFGTSNPYRQKISLADQRMNSIQDPNIGKTYIVADIERSLKKMYLSAANVGFRSGQPIIDLTGQSPMVIYALNAYPVGSPWMVGGYSGSNALAKGVLADVNCSVLVDSWLLIEPTGPRSLNVVEVLSSFGANIKNYKLVASWKSPRGAGGYSEARLQQMYKPIKKNEEIQFIDCNRQFN